MMKSRTLSDLWGRLRSMMEDRSIRRIAFSMMALLGLLFIGFAAYKNWNEFSQFEFDYRYILLALLLYPAGMLPTMAGWHTLLEAIGVELPFKANLRFYSLSALPRHIPGFVWYVTSRSMLYQEANVAVGLTVAATGAEIALSALTGFVLSVPLVLLNVKSIRTMPGISSAGLAALVLLVALIATAPILNRILQRALREGNTDLKVQIRPVKIIITLAWMCAAWAGGGLILFALARALQPVELQMLPGFIGAWGAAGAVSLTIGIGIQGFGIREVTLGALLNLMLPTLTAVVLAVAFRLVLTIGEFLWVLFFIWITRPRQALSQT